jgi:hypothetical protein
MDKVCRKRVRRGLRKTSIRFDPLTHACPELRFADPELISEDVVPEVRSISGPIGRM